MSCIKQCVNNTSKSLFGCSFCVSSALQRLIITFTFMHLADAFIQSDLQCIQAIHLFLSVHVFTGNRTHNLCAANAMLYHWATGTPCNYVDNVFLKGTKEGGHLVRGTPKSFDTIRTLVHAGGISLTLPASSRAKITSFSPPPSCRSWGSIRWSKLPPLTRTFFTFSCLEDNTRRAAKFTFKAGNSTCD